VDKPTATVVSGATTSLKGTTNFGSINWSVPSGQGTMVYSNTASDISNDYTAPANLMSDLAVTVTLTNSANSAKTATSAITVKTLNTNADSVIDLQDLLRLAGDWGSTESRSRLSGGATVGDADLALLLTGLGLN
jgi:hypothetical protein